VLQCVAVCCSAEDILLLNILCSVTTETFDVSRSVLLCDAVCYSALQCVAVQTTFCYSMYHTMFSNYRDLVHIMHCVAVCCSVLQCVAVCCSVLQCVAVCCSVLQCAAVCCSVLQCAAVSCSVMQCNAVCY